MVHNLVPLVISLAATVVGVSAIDKDIDASLDQNLRSSPTELDSMNLLPDDDDWLFDYTQQEYYTYSPGGVANANAATFPAAVRNGMTMALITLGPCAVLPPHFHSRAANYVTAVDGETVTYMILENGARTVKATLTPGKMTIFPQGSVHTMQNVGCENATLVSALNSADAGTHNIANALFNLPSQLLSAAFGNNAAVKDSQPFLKSIPEPGTGASFGDTECLQKCGLDS